NNEAKMIEKISLNVSDNLNATPSRDFDGMVGLEGHLGKIQCLLILENDEPMTLGISGPAGIGLRVVGSSLGGKSGDEWEVIIHRLETSLDEDLERVLRVGYETLHEKDQALFLHIAIFFNNKDQDYVKSMLHDCNLNVEHGLRNLVNRSLIDISTNGEIVMHSLLQQMARQVIQRQEPWKRHILIDPHEICDVLEYETLAIRVAELCGNLPLGLRVVGSSLGGKSGDEWEVIIHRLETSLDEDLERVLRVGYETLHEKDQALFLHIAIFFNNKDQDYVKSMLHDCNLNVEHGLRNLVNRSLIDISTNGEIVMHSLLQQMARQVIQRQEPWKRHILIDPHEICDVLEYETQESTSREVVFTFSSELEIVECGVQIWKDESERNQSAYSKPGNGEEEDVSNNQQDTYNISKAWDEEEAEENVNLNPAKRTKR
ncbi:hypothetical protein F2Q68_00019808, partial [Brassica cretica]